MNEHAKAVHNCGRPTLPLYVPLWHARRELQNQEPRNGKDYLFRNSIFKCERLEWECSIGMGWVASVCFSRVRDREVIVQHYDFSRPIGVLHFNT